jgi:hypothetical protein
LASADERKIVDATEPWAAPTDLHAFCRTVVDRSNGRTMAPVNQREKFLVEMEC